jgi:hypothetical protein
MRKTAALLALAAAAWAAPAAAQGSIRAGMTADEVRAAFGPPATVRQTDGWTYLFYHNGCPRRCGSDDVVFLQEGRVVAAVLRTARRRFAGPPAAAALESVDPGPPGDRALVLEGDGDAGGRMRAADDGPPDVLRVRQRADEGGDIRPPAAPGEPAARYRTGGERMGDDATVGDIRVRGRADTSTVVAPSLDEGRRERERAVNPRSIPAGEPSSPVAAPPMDPRQRERERSVPPRSVHPPRAGLPPAQGLSADTIRPPAPPR